MAFAGLAFHEGLVGVAVIGNQGEIELLALKVGTGHLDFHLVAQGVFISVLASDQTVVLLIKIVLVVGKVAYRDKTLTHIIGEFDIETPFSDAGNNAIVNLSKAVAHKFHLLVAYA